MLQSIAMYAEMIEIRPVKRTMQAPIPIICQIRRGIRQI